MRAANDADDTRAAFEATDNVVLAALSFDAYFGRLRDAVALHALDGRLLEQNEAALRLRTICPWDDVSHGSNARSAFADACNGRTAIFEAQVRSTEGDLRVLVQFAPVVVDGVVRGVLEIDRDQIVAQAVPDELEDDTGLPTLTILYDRMTRLLMHSRRDGRPFALHLVSVVAPPESSAAVIAETHRLAVERLTSTVRSVDTVARLGRVYAVVQPDVFADQSSGALARRLGAQLSAPFELGGTPYVPQVFIGTAVSDRRTTSVDDLVSEADLELSRLKLPRRVFGIRPAAEIDRA